MRTNTIYFSSGEPSVEVLRLSKDGIWANPDIPVDDAAKFVINAIGYNIKVLVEKAVEEEREECAKIVESHGSTLANGLMLTEAIRARGQA